MTRGEGYLIVSSDTDSVISRGSDLVAVVIEALDLGYGEGTIYNEHNNASRDLADWVEENANRIHEHLDRKEMAETE